MYKCGSKYSYPNSSWHIVDTQYVPGTIIIVFLGREKP